MLAPLAPSRARALVRAMSGRRLLIAGDVMLDQFIVGHVHRISPEAPVPIVAYDRDEYRAGGAANVALNARALGAQVDLVALVGADDAAWRLREILSAADVGVSGLITDDKRRTTTKVRIVTDRNQQVARIDYESDAPASAVIESSTIEQIETRLERAHAIVVSDYLKGVVTRRLMASVVAASQSRRLPAFVDPKIAHIDYYGGGVMVTPNLHEAELATNLRIRANEDARRVAEAFRERARCGGVLITMGEHGMWLSADGVEGHLPASAREVADVTGAGDTVVAALALAVAAGATAAEAAQIANAAAGIVVGKFGPASATAEEILAAWPG
jgi:rfaE bifunctional protein kinase chain/domain